MIFVVLVLERRARERSFQILTKNLAEIDQLIKEMEKK
jgi:hypothetical protein